MVRNNITLKNKQRLLMRLVIRIGRSYADFPLVFTLWATQINDTLIVN